MRMVGYASLHQPYAANRTMQPSKPTSYSLPANNIPKVVRESLHPWIEGFVGLETIQATIRMHDRWRSIDRKSLLALRETLSAFEVREIVDFGDGGQIRAVRPNAEDESVGNCFYLPAPLCPSILKSRLELASLSSKREVQEFMLHFAGLAEDTNVSGNFLYAESPWPLFTKSYRDHIYDEEEFEEWENSLMLFSARNGCHVLLHPSGRVAWWVLQEGLIRELAASFDDFIFQFNDHRKLAWPYDPYGP